MSPGTRLSIVLPCYNEAPNLASLIENYRSVFRDEHGVELILVDNGSSDGTAGILSEVSKIRGAGPAFRSVCLQKNLGYGGGIWAGLRIARGEFVGWSHADHQCPAEDVLTAYRLICSRPLPSFVKGTRVNARGFAGFLSALHGFFASVILGKRMREINAQPKLFPRRLLDTFHTPPLGFELDTYAYYRALAAGYEVVTIPVSFLRRRHGQSHWATSVPARLRFMWRQFSYLWELKRDEIFRSLRSTEQRAGRRWLPS